MRSTLVGALVLSASTAFACAQANLWRHVSPDAGPQNLQTATLTSAQLKSVDYLLRHQKSNWDCEGPELKEMIEGLRFETIPVPGRQAVILAEAPAGCARGGQGSNGAMWVIRFEGATPALLATPDDFSGWLFAVLPTLSHGYPAIVLGWHMSAAESGLNYMRFNGKIYRSIGGASLVSDDAGNPKIDSGSK